MGLLFIKKKRWGSYGGALSKKMLLCEKKEETVDHLLAHCSQTRVIWDLLLVIVSVKWVFSLSVRETILSRGVSFVVKKH